MRIGLKLWSINTDFYYEEAKKLYNQGYFDYVEPITILSKPKRIEITISLIN